MRKFVIAAITLTLLILSCKSDIYVPKRSTDICRIEYTYYQTIQKAADAIVERALGGTRSISESNTIHLVQDVTEDYSLAKRSGIYIPEEYTGEIVIDFGDYQYFFSNSTTETHFFEVDGGSNILIVNGTSVILEDSAMDPAALKVTTDVVKVTNHVIDDRRKRPKAIEVDNNGIIDIGDDATITGDVNLKDSSEMGIEGGDLSFAKVETDNATMDISGGNVHIEELELNNGTGVGITGGVVVIDNIVGLGKVEMSDGDVTINDIDESQECQLEISGGIIRNPHAIQEKIDQAIVNGANVENIVIHEWKIVEEKILAEPTCTEDGRRYVEYECECCHEHQIYDNEPIPALGHEFKEWETDEHEHWHECSRCHAVEDKGDHNEKKLCQDGDKGHYRACTICEYHKEEEAHTYDENESCTVCGYNKQGGGSMGGFDIEVIINEPLGYLVGEKNGMECKVTYVDLEGEPKHIPASSFEWKVNDEKQEEKGKVLNFTKKYNFTYRVECTYSNEYGTEVCSLIV